ncbi:hypothetical protein ANN_17291, partial [Periplaneta americana]
FKKLIKLYNLFHYHYKNVKFHRFRKNSLLHLLSFADCFTWEDLPPKDPVTGNTSMGVWIRRINTTAVRITTFGLSVYFLHSFTRNILSEERFLMLDAWYPYDWSKSPVFEITNVIQAIATVGFAAFVYAFPPLYATLVLIACSQLEKLRATLSNIKQKCILFNEKASDESKEQFQISEEMFSQMKEQLNNCVRLHQDIIRFTMELEDNFRTLFVGVFLILMVTLCLASFSAVLRWGNALNVMQSVAVYFVLTIFVFLFCWFPSELTDQADRVRDAAWNCDWVGTPVCFQRALSILMTCANKEIIMTAGNCVPVSKETMMNVSTAIITTQFPRTKRTKSK